MLGKLRLMGLLSQTRRRGEQTDVVGVGRVADLGGAIPEGTEGGEQGEGSEAEPS